MAEAFSRCRQLVKWHFREDTNNRFLASCTRFCPPCDVFAGALPPVGLVDEHQSDLQPCVRYDADCRKQCAVARFHKCGAFTEKPRRPKRSKLWRGTVSIDLLGERSWLPGSYTLIKSVMYTGARLWTA